MKAIVQHTYGAPQAILALQDIAQPVVTDDEVLVIRPVNASPFVSST